LNDCLTFCDSIPVIHGALSVGKLLAKQPNRLVTHDVRKCRSDGPIMGPMYQLVVPPDQAISPVSDGAEGHGIGNVLPEPAVHAVQPEALQLLEALRRGVRRPGPIVLSFVVTL
jgi:hypothetical protein